MEGNEMHVFSHSQSLDSEKDDSIDDTISSNNRGGFRHFVEESTLRNISLDELEEISEAGCLAVVDGKIRRTSSSVSSEQPVRFAVIIECHWRQFLTHVGIARLLLLLFDVISLATLVTAGNEDADVLDMPFSPFARAHIFVVVFSMLIDLTFLFLEVTGLIDSFPKYLSVIDTVLHLALCLKFGFTSSALTLAMVIYRFSGPPVTFTVIEHLLVSSFFGFACAAVSLLLTVMRACAHKRPHISDDIVLTTISSA